MLEYTKSSYICYLFQLMDTGQNGPIILHVHKLVAVELTFVTGHAYGMTLIHMDQSVMEQQMKVIPVIQRLVQVCITLLRQNGFYILLNAIGLNAG